MSASVGLTPRTVVSQGPFNSRTASAGSRSQPLWQSTSTGAREAAGGGCSPAALVTSVAGGELSCVPFTCCSFDDATVPLSFE